PSKWPRVIVGRYADVDRDGHGERNLCSDAGKQPAFGLQEGNRNCTPWKAENEFAVDQISRVVPACSERFSMRGRQRRELFVDDLSGELGGDLAFGFPRWMHRAIYGKRPTQCLPAAPGRRLRSLAKSRPRRWSFIIRRSSTSRFLRVGR